MVQQTDPGRLSSTQLRTALGSVLTETPGTDPEVTQLIICLTEIQDSLRVLSSADLALGIRVGFELVRKYGLLSADEVALHGGAEQIINEAAHRYGLHLAWVSRRQFEDYLGDEDAPRPLTDEEWGELEDRYDDYCDSGPGHVAEYMDNVLGRAGWMQDDDGTWTEAGR